MRAKAAIKKPAKKKERVEYRDPTHLTYIKALPCRICKRITIWGLCLVFRAEEVKRLLLLKH